MLHCPEHILTILQQAMQAGARVAFAYRGRRLRRVVVRAFPEAFRGVLVASGFTTDGVEAVWMPC